MGGFFHAGVSRTPGNPHDLVIDFAVLESRGILSPVEKRFVKLLKPVFNVPREPD
jgi:hypothetical protein